MLNKKVIIQSKSRKALAKSIGYPLQDFFRNTDILEKLTFLKESQYWDYEKTKDYQSHKLRKLVEHAYKNVPYYKELFDGIKLKPSDIKSVDDIQKIPILTKEIVRDENEKLVAKDFDMRYVKKGKTGGTTGAPIKVYKDTNNRSFTWASYYRWYEWMGLKFYSSSVTFWGASTVLNKSYKQKAKEKFIELIQNSKKIDSFKLTENEMWRIYKTVSEFNPSIIKGYLSSLLDFGSFLKRNNLYDISPEAISTTTETLSKHNRKFLNHIFNAPIYDQYGCGELSAISYECKAHNGLHINTEHSLIEILDNNDLSVIDKKGRVVGTDLDNYVMPFIRYENGDISSVSSKECSCGVKQPLMNAIDGRTIDTVILKSGQKVHGVFFTNILYELGILTDEVQKFQIIQNVPGEVQLKLESQKTLSEEKRKKLKDAINSYVDITKYSEVQHLEAEKNGKFKYIINNIRE